MGPLLSSVGSQLALLNIHFFVELTSAIEPGMFRLELVHRERGYHPRSYSGQLEQVVFRAYRDAFVVPDAVPAG